MIYDNTDKHLKSGRRTYTCTADNIRCGIRIKSFYFVSALQQSGKNSFQKRLLRLLPYPCVTSAKVYGIIFSKFSGETST